MARLEPGRRPFDPGCMRFVGILSLAVMALTGVGVAFRLIALARRSGQQPEQLMSVGLLLVAVVGGPIAAIGRAPAAYLAALRKRCAATG